jgi:hypothetical protein
VLKDADDWVSGLEALVAAKQMSEETEAEQEAVDIAGSQLVLGGDTVALKPALA